MKDKKKSIEKLLRDPSYKNNKYLLVHLEVAIKKVNNLLSKRGPK